MSTGVKFTKSGIPVPLDSFGNEMCLLFIKYGRCRFKKKCKKSHWTPPLPDEEYPMLPPLPPSSPPCPSTFDSYPSSNRNITSQLSAGEERQNLPPTDISFHQKKCNVYRGNNNIGLASTESASLYSQGFIASQTPKNKDLLGCYIQEETFEIVQPLGLDKSDGIHTDPDPGFMCTSSTSSRSPTFISNLQDLSVNTTKPVNASECSTVEEATPVNANLTVQGLEKTVDRIIQEIYQEKYRFDSVYHPKRPAKGSGWKYQSNTDQNYKHYGAYYDRIKGKLQVQNEPCNKAEKKRLKLLRKAHWNTSQVLKTRLAQLPSSYSLNVNFARVNFNRLRPYFYLLVQQCFVCAELAKMTWRPTGFSCLVADTLIAFFTNCNITPVEAETKMLNWGARHVRVRQCISHMWSIIVKSSLSTAGVAQEVVACENQVFAKKLCAVDYAYACSLAAPLMKVNVNMSTPTVTKSVRQGIQAAKKASLVGQKPKFLKLQRVSENASVRKKSAPVEKTSAALDKGVSKTKGVTCKKKRKTRRSRQLSLLDQQGKQDLQKRCKTILDNVMDCT